MPSNVFLIAAVGRSGQLGLGGTMPWLDQNDLRWFRRNTLGHVVVLGRKTAEHTLVWPDRTVHVMTREQTPEQVIAMYPDRQIWVGGGAVIYKLWLPHVYRSFITRVDYDGPADTWMPSLWNDEDRRRVRLHAPKWPPPGTMLPG